eukprot:TRINITY_DN3534_c0_g1_i4.p1 TRINITY_DN3534_c0_g1~~TRINITY_DN3534_c0_g1_i4.p1  ORF type:complete len:318 (+),score=66.12 TRINITY_DN3534_c0_g1_i4:85-1038(+)
MEIEFKEDWPKYTKNPSPIRKDILIQQPNNEKEMLTVCSYNILAKKYSDISLYKDYDPNLLDWNERKKKLKEQFEELMQTTDIFCFQEMDSFDELVEEGSLKSEYDSAFKKRTGTKKDGVCICWNKKRFNLLSKTEIEFNECRAIKRDRVGLIVELQSKKNKRVVVTVCNVHLDYKSQQVREKQVEYLLDKLKEKGHPSPQKTLIIAGDFNDIPNSNVYEMLLSFNLPSGVNDKKNSSNRKTSEKNLSSAYPSKTPHNELICTSFFLDNKQIDFIFYSHKNLALISLLEPYMTYSSLPDENMPSDHTCIKASFQFNN